MIELEKIWNDIEPIIEGLIDNGDEEEVAIDFPPNRLFIRQYMPMNFSISMCALKDNRAIRQIWSHKVEAELIKPKRRKRNLK